MQDEGNRSGDPSAIISNGHNFAKRVCRILNNVIQEKALRRRSERQLKYLMIWHSNERLKKAEIFSL